MRGVLSHAAGEHEAVRQTAMRMATDTTFADLVNTTKKAGREANSLAKEIKANNGHIKSNNLSSQLSWLGA